MFKKNSLLLVAMLFWMVQVYAVGVVPLTEGTVSVIEQDGRVLYSYCECSDGLPIGLPYIVKVSKHLEAVSDNGFLKALFAGKSSAAFFEHENSLQSFCVQLTFGATSDDAVGAGDIRLCWTDIRIYGTSDAVPKDVVVCVKNFVELVFSEPC